MFLFYLLIVPIKISAWSQVKKFPTIETLLLVKVIEIGPLNFLKKYISKFVIR